MTYLIPARYFIEIIRGIVLRGADFADLWRPVAALVVYTVLIVGVAVFRFRKTSAVGDVPALLRGCSAAGCGR